MGMGTLFISLCSPARVVAFHAGCTTAMAAIVNILAAISCFVLLERSNTFCRHCCPVMGKNFCDRKSQVTWATHPLALKKASSARSKNIENCFPSFFSLAFCHFSLDAGPVFAFIFVKFSSAVIFLWDALQELFVFAKCYFNAGAPFFCSSSKPSASISVGLY